MEAVAKDAAEHGDVAQERQLRNGVRINVGKQAAQHDRFTVANAQRRIDAAIGDDRKRVVEAFSGSFITDYGSSPSRCGPLIAVVGPEISRFPSKERAHKPGSLTTRGADRALAIARLVVLPSAIVTASALPN